MEKNKVISIKNSKVNFKVTDNFKSILDNAIDQDISLPYGCKSGTCGSCATKLVKGDVINKNKEDISNNSQILLCQSLANSHEVVLEYYTHQLAIINENNNYDNEKIKAKEYLLQVTSNKSVTPMVKELCLHIPEKLNFRFLPGSHMELVYNDQFIRQYSILNSPTKSHRLNNNIIKFLIVCHNKKGVSYKVHNDIKPGDLIKFKGPYQSFHYNLNNDQPIIGIAGGTGISPIVSVIKNILENNSQLTILIFLSVRNKDEILEMNSLMKMKDKYRNFNFKISLTREKDLINSIFLSGRVDLSLQKIFKDLSTHKVLIAGSYGFVECAYKHAIKLNAKKENIFYEKFS